VWMLYTARSLVGKGPRPKSVDEDAIDHEQASNQDDRRGGGGEEQLAKAAEDVGLDDGEGGVRIR